MQLLVMRGTRLSLWRCTVSRVSLWNAILLINNSADFWYFFICRKATVPGRYLRGNFAPPVIGAILRAAFNTLGEDSSLNSLARFRFVEIFDVLRLAIVECYALFCWIVVLDCWLLGVGK